jgi:hypothetical protein
MLTSQQGVNFMSICTEVLKLTMRLSLSNDPVEIKDQWSHIIAHARQCNTCSLALEAITKGTRTKARAGAVADWDVDPLEFQNSLNTNLSRLATQFNELYLGAETDKATRLRESIEKEVAALPLTKRAHLLLLLLLAPGKSGIIGENIQGIVRIMKLLFLMKMDAGLDKYVSDYYPFAPYKLGPFEKAVYDDLDALVERNLVERKPVGKDQLEPESRLPKELDTDKNIDFIDFDRTKTNAIYQLTSTGRKYAQAYAKGAEQVNPTIIRDIRDIKSTWAYQPLKRLLIYVYKKYPEYTTESEILDKVLGWGE